MRTLEQNEALEQERAAAQRAIEDARHAADEGQRRASARGAQLAAAARASFESGAGARQSAPARPGREPRSSARASGSGGRRAESMDEALSRLQQETDSVSHRAQQALARSVQLVQSFDGHMGEVEEERLERGGAARRSVDATSAHADAHSAPGRTVPSTPVANSQADAQQACMSAAATGAEASGNPGRVCWGDAPTPSASAAPHKLEESPASTGAAEDSESDGAVATGAYSSMRYAAYSEELNVDMQLRFQAGLEAGNLEAGYESDLDRDNVHMQQNEAAEAAALLAQSLEHEAVDESAQNFTNDNTWMDEYRKTVVSRCSPHPFTSCLCLH